MSISLVLMHWNEEDRNAEVRRLPEVLLASFLIGMQDHLHEAASADAPVVDLLCSFRCHRPFRCRIEHGVFLLCYGVSVVWGAAWLIRLAVHAWKSRAGTVTQRRGFVYWATEPLAFTLAVLISHSEVPFRLRFMASQRSLTQYAQSMKDPERDSRTWVGLYLLRERTEMLPGGVVRFITCDTGFGDDAGFAFAPKSPPPVIGEDSYTKLPFAEGWYRWERSW